MAIPAGNQMQMALSCLASGVARSQGNFMTWQLSRAQHARRRERLSNPSYLEAKRLFISKQLRPATGQKSGGSLISCSISLKNMEYVPRNVREVTSSDILSSTGPPRFFSPLVSAASQVPAGAPLLVFLAGIEGTGFSAYRQFDLLYKQFQVEVFHIPPSDRTPFEGLVDHVVEHIQQRRRERPEQPIYLLGESFGGLLALASVMRNHELVDHVILANPATSFNESPLKPMLPLLTQVPEGPRQFLPILLSPVLGDTIKIMNGIIGEVPAAEYPGKLRDTMVNMLPVLQVLQELFPTDTLAWKLDLLEHAATSVNRRLSDLPEDFKPLVLYSGKDNLLPSQKEAKRLKRAFPNAILRRFENSGHALLQEADVDVATEIRYAGLYKRSRARSRGFNSLADFLPPSDEQLKTLEPFLNLQRNLCSPVYLSTDAQGQRQLGLEHVPTTRPLLFVSNHQLLAPDMPLLIYELYKKQNLFVRGLAHPAVFNGFGADVSPNEANRSMAADKDANSDAARFFRAMGAVPVSPSNLYKLLGQGEAALLYPGGVREAYKRKGEEYKLFWPDRAEFVRMAIRHGATIVPVGAVGADDGVNMILDSEEQLQLPVWGDRLREQIKRIPQARYV
eukprot:jgi/Mesvir1/14188/Mv09645-RA.1